MDGREIDESRLNENRVEAETLGQTSQSCMRMEKVPLRSVTLAGWLAGDFLASSAPAIFVGVRVVFDLCCGLFTESKRLPA